MSSSGGGAVSWTPEYRKIYDKLKTKSMPSKQMLNEYAKAHDVLPIKLQNMLDDLRKPTKKRKIAESVHETDEEASEVEEDVILLDTKTRATEKGKTPVQERAGIQTGAPNPGEEPMVRTEIESQLFEYGAMMTALGDSLYYG